MPFTKDSARADITRELLMGATPAQLARKGYPEKSCYRIRDELAASGQLPEPGTIVVDEGGSEPNPFIPATPAPATPAPSTVVAEGKKETGAETVELGPDSLPIDAVNRIRGILGISLRPKVLNMPMPELLYPSMVIAVTELGFPPMRPDDFIDTVLYQWLEACDYIPYAYMKVSELERLAKKYGVAETEGEVAKKKPPKDDIGIAKEIIESIEPIEEVSNEEALETTESNVEEEPHKPTVGDLLSRLNINNIRKEVENDSQG